MDVGNKYELSLEKQEKKKMDLYIYCYLVFLILAFLLAEGKLAPD